MLAPHCCRRCPLRRLRRLRHRCRRHLVLARLPPPDCSGTRARYVPAQSSWLAAWTVSTSTSRPHRSSTEKPPLTSPVVPSPHRRCSYCYCQPPTATTDQRHQYHRRGARGGGGGRGGAAEAAAARTLLLRPCASGWRRCLCPRLHRWPSLRPPPSLRRLCRPASRLPRLPTHLPCLGTLSTWLVRHGPPLPPLPSQSHRPQTRRTTCFAIR